MQRIYRDGLEAEAPWIGRTVQLQKVDNPFDLAGDLFSDDLFPPEDKGPDQENADDLDAFGVGVRRSSKVTPLYRPAKID